MANPSWGWRSSLPHSMNGAAPRSRPRAAWIVAVAVAGDVTVSMPTTRTSEVSWTKVASTFTPAASSMLNAPSARSVVGQGYGDP